MGPFTLGRAKWDEVAALKLDLESPAAKAISRALGNHMHECGPAVLLTIVSMAIEDIAADEDDERWDLLVGAVEDLRSVVVALNDN